MTADRVRHKPSTSQQHFLQRSEKDKKVDQMSQMRPASQQEARMSIWMNTSSLQTDWGQAATFMSKLKSLLLATNKVESLKACGKKTGMKTCRTKLNSIDVFIARNFCTAYVPIPQSASNQTLLNVNIMKRHRWGECFHLVVYSSPIQKARWHLYKVTHTHKKHVSL